jgi:hypothetical protein
MGLGLDGRTSSSPKDIMESSILPETHSNAQRYRNRVFKHVLRNRDIFGYPKGSTTFPYMFCSNDLAGIFLEFMKLLEKHQDNTAIMEITTDLVGILKLLILSYDDEGNCDHGCCSYWHSVPKEGFIELRKRLKRAAAEEQDDKLGGAACES